MVIVFTRILKCPKCLLSTEPIEFKVSGVNISGEYFPNGEPKFTIEYYKNRREKEYLEVSCNRCGFGFDMSCADEVKD